MRLASLIHKKDVETERTLLFQGEWPLFSLIEKIADNSVTLEYDRAWKIVYDYFFERKDRTSLLNESKSLIEWVRSRIGKYEVNWRYAFVSLVALYVNRQLDDKGNDYHERFMENIMNYLKDNDYFVKESILPKELGFAYGLWDEKKSLEMIRTPDKESIKVFKIYYYLAFKLTNRNGERKDLQDIAKEYMYDRYAGILFRNIASSCIVDHIEDEICEQILSELQHELFDVKEFTEIYLRRSGLSSYEEEYDLYNLPSIFNYGIAQLYQFLIALRMLGLNKVVYISKKFAERIKDYFKKTDRGKKKVFILSKAMFL